MRILRSCALASLASSLVVTYGARAQNVAQPSETAAPCKDVHDFASTDCTLTWHGITIYGTYDVGVGWVSHGLPENAYNYEGESLINRIGKPLPVAHRAE